MKRLVISFTALAMMLLLCTGLVQPGYAEGTHPVAENLEIKTYRGVSVGGKLNAYDPEGDALSYEISTQPVKGELTLNDDGSFVYTPAEGKKGRDYFGYRATDSNGSSSQEATVIIRIEKQKRDVSYIDLHGTALEYPAVELSESGLFTAEEIGGNYCFYPDKGVTKGEFLSMCMQLSGEPVFSGVLSTGCADDSDIPDWMKGYVATAAMRCVPVFSMTEEGCVFAPDQTISRSEAAMILDKALDLTEVSYLPLDETMELSMAQSCANVSACGLIAEGEPLSENLTRADAALLICSAMELLRNRAE